MTLILLFTPPLFDSHLFNVDPGRLYEIDSHLVKYGESRLYNVVVVMANH